MDTMQHCFLDCRTMSLQGEEQVHAREKYFLLIAHIRGKQNPQGLLKMRLAAICKQDAATAVMMVLEKRKQK